MTQISYVSGSFNERNDSQKWNNSILESNFVNNDTKDNSSETQKDSDFYKNADQLY